MYELRLSSSNENEKQSRTLEELESDLDNVVNHNYIHQETDVDTHYQTTYITIYITIYYHIYYVLYDSRSGTCYTTLPYCESYTIRHIKEADSLSRIFSVVMNLLKTYTNETKSPKSQSFFPFMIDHVTLAYMERQKSLQCYKTIQSAYLYIRCRLRQWRWMRAQSCYSRRGERGQVYTSMDCGTLDFDLRSNPQSYLKTLPQTPSTFVHPIPSFECLFNFVFVKNMKPSFDIWFSHNDVIQIILQNWLFFLFSIALLLINFTLKWHNSNVGSYVKELATLQRTCNLQRKSCASFVKNNFLFR